MNMVMITYNEALDGDVMDVLKSCGLKNYTKILDAFGSGDASGIHMGDDIWPGKNHIMYVACEQPQAKQLISAIKELRKKLGHEGVKAFVLPIEEVT